MRGVDATRLPVDPSPSGWNAILPEPGPARELEGPVNADWLVIGAGFAGLAAARRLRQLRPDDRIVVLEASRVGHGPAGRNSGFMVDLPHDLSSDTYAGAAWTTTGPGCSRPARRSCSRRPPCAASPPVSATRASRSTSRRR